MDELLLWIFSSQWRVIGFSAALLLLLAEIGFRSGAAARRNLDDGQKSQVGALQASLLGLLALMLGFTFAMAVARHDARRALAAKESNSISTTYLRASFLPETVRSNVVDLLLRYAESRSDFNNAGKNETRIADAERVAAALHEALWAQAVAAGRESPSPLVALFVNSLNETIDLDGSRREAFRNHVPAAVWLLVLIVAGSGCFAWGYGGGVGGRRLLLAQVTLPLLIAVVITVLVDLDSPRQGLIRNSAEPAYQLGELIEAMRRGTL